MKYTLIVVDMQHMFPASSKCLDACKDIVRAFVKTNNDIVFVEYVGCGQTISSLKRLTRNAHYVYKDKCDGSKEINECVTKNALSTNFVVCGVNTGACVLQTVSGLTYYSNKLYVFEPGCADRFDHKVNEIIERVKGTKKITNAIELYKLISNQSNSLEACP
jgi:nicotinamidase-related amidase